MISQRKLVTWLLLTTVSVAALSPLGGIALLWALCVPFLIVFAFLRAVDASVDTRDFDFPSSATLHAAGSRAPPLG
jgi:hypothetical protein